MIEYLGYFAAFLIGLVLGLIGGGGSILTVPVLVYLLGIHPVIATAYSLFIVGTTSAFGTILNYKKGLVEIKTGLKFAVPSLLAIYFTRKYLIHLLPENLLNIGNITITKDFFLMVLFAMVMILASLSMIYGRNDQKEKNTRPNLYISFFQMLFVGTIIGLIGAGGGFLFIPALLYIEKLPIKKAVGTSVFIIAINSLIGFSGDVCHIKPDWYFLIVFTLIAILGIFVGIYINKFINEKSLKKGFGWFVLFMSIFILAKEILF